MNVSVSVAEGKLKIKKKYSLKSSLLYNYKNLHNSTLNVECSG